jgi:alpha-N-arabinofuranosidase
MNSCLALFKPSSLCLGLMLTSHAQQLHNAEVPALRSLDPPVVLPDGTEFKTWEQPLRFSKTYYVDSANPKASDQNPGTKAGPFATINHAAQILQPGERVVVAAGIYRERISPARGGSGPSSMISYEAASGAKVVLKGSRPWPGPWVPDSTVFPARIWKTELAAKYFGNYNPFEIDNVTSRQFEIMDYAAPLRGTAPCNLPRGLVFQDGRILTQVSTRADLTAREGTYWVDRAGHTLYVRSFGGAQPADATMELTTQETIFAPEQMGLGYIRVKGFTVEHAAGPFPWEQVGAISTTRGHHWIIEDNTVRWVNGVGIDAGVQLHRWPQPQTVGFHVIRRNTVTECGICGICGLGPGGNTEFGLLIEDNVLLRNAFFDTERLFETGGIKTHNNVRCLIRRNLIADTLHGPGIWMDWDNRNSRCCQNVILHTRTIHGGIFVEASFVPNLVDQNFIWQTEGHGIYEHDCSHQIFAHNFIGHSSGSGLWLHGKMTGRRIAGRDPEYGLHEVRNNILFENTRTNRYGGQASKVAGNLSDGLVATFNREKMELIWSVEAKSLPPTEPVPRMTHDFWGKRRKEIQVSPGPFGPIPTHPERVVLGTNWPLPGRKN